MPLKETLERLGVPLFQQNNPLLSGLTENNIPVYLSSAVQKAVITVDEKGTTAAAVTVAEAYCAPPEPNKTFEMICNKPFVFVLCDYTHDSGNLILFTGIVNQP